ncbi:GLoBin related [Ditylenchus destructor]|uniref:GLoBin related n=1 Tax=Ditylenchus destructor TaxID=166010 RepID=A0AAD4NDC5_9BILA|nr:GLoBin related [Ditylenchus destructor]
MYQEYQEFLRLLGRHESLDMYQLNNEDDLDNLNLGHSSSYGSSPIESSLDGDTTRHHKFPVLKKDSLTGLVKAKMSNAIWPISGDMKNFDEDEEECALELESIQLARAHWIALHRMNLQTSAVQQMFIHLLKNHKQMRPLWQFTRSIDDTNESWTNDLLSASLFRHHCTSFQAALTMIMDNLDDYAALSRLLQELGSHHFFYDAFEPHLELMHDSFIEALKKLLEGTSEAIDEELQNAWDQLWHKIKVNMGYGISLQRQIYLTQCVTPSEMKTVRAMWDKVKQNQDMLSCGEEVASTALKLYEELVKKYNIEDMRIGTNGLIEHNGEVFVKFSKEIINSLDRTIAVYSPERGFIDLIDELKYFVHNCIIMDVCPSLVRKAFMQGLISMLSSVLGDAEMNENVVHTWTKIYRVLEQACIANIVEY